jgi:hypothetical protein
MDEEEEQRNKMMPKNEKTREIEIKINSLPLRLVEKPLRAFSRGHRPLPSKRIISVNIAIVLVALLVPPSPTSLALSLSLPTMPSDSYVEQSIALFVAVVVVVVARVGA